MAKQRDEVEVTQYLRPFGRTQLVYAPVGEEYAIRANTAALILSAEVLSTGIVAIYGRRPDQDESEETLELAQNGPGDAGPIEQLQKIIDRLTLPANLRKQAI
jgi:hypothetical protein